MQRILIVEDEIKTGSYLRQGLEEVGYHVELFHNGREGLNAILKGHYELIILDIMLPSLNGWQIIEEMRKSGHEEPVLFLTAKDNVQDKVKGLELGADDYLIKPFDFERLRQALLAYKNRARLIRDHEKLTQEELDAGVLPKETTDAETAASLPKGLDRYTLSIIANCLKEIPEPFTTEELSRSVGLSRVSVRKYLEYFCGTGQLEKEASYGAVGRPVFRYRKK